MVPVKVPDPPKEDHSQRPIHAHALNDMLSKRGRYFGSRFVTVKDLAITEEEFHCFEQKQGFQTLSEKNYPPELKIAVEVWREVLGSGIKESSLGMTKSDAVKKALQHHKLSVTAVKRIANIVVSDKSRTLLKDTITTSHNRNEPHHPYYSKSLADAVSVWKRIEGGSNLKNLAKTILESFYSENGDNQNELIQIMVAPGQ